MKERHCQENKAAPPAFPHVPGMGAWKPRKAISISFLADSASVTSLVQASAWHMFRAVVGPSGRHHCRDFCSAVTGLKVGCCPAHQRGVLLLEGESSHT